MIWVAYAAPFAAFRQFSAGYFRPTFPFAPPSALYGLLLNIAGIESRGPLGPGATAMAKGLPSFRIASAATAPDDERHSFADLLAEAGRMPGRGALYQQLHTTPVGEVNKERKPLTKGNKHHIAPAWRELLTTLRGVCAVDADLEFEELLRSRIECPEGSTPSRYGLPFAGDNNFFLEDLSLVQPGTDIVDWLVKDEEMAEGQRFRLTVSIDRAGMKDTQQADFRLQAGPLNSPPLASWVAVGPSL